MFFRSLQDRSSCLCSAFCRATCIEYFIRSCLSTTFFTFFKSFFSVSFFSKSRYLSSLHTPLGASFLSLWTWSSKEEIRTLPGKFFQLLCRSFSAANVILSLWNLLFKPFFEYFFRDYFYLFFRFLSQNACPSGRIIRKQKESWLKLPVAFIKWTGSDAGARKARSSPQH